ncbi:hypothetical protein CDAR_478151 [Caerostris darwini]|uniref:Uncharacterized protein n=1 Tax=Caerostris darwini TaxID=1538125 RepID=A0AAV4UKB5_9ARAC|nr:hypothetical protein CDAR_478151 [Caerostris darwini]
MKASNPPLSKVRRLTVKIIRGVSVFGWELRRDPGSGRLMVILGEGECGDQRVLEVNEDLGVKISPDSVILKLASNNGID